MGVQSGLLCPEAHRLTRAPHPRDYGRRLPVLTQIAGRPLTGTVLQFQPLASVSPSVSRLFPRAGLP